MPVRPNQLDEWDDKTEMFVTPIKFRGQIYALDKMQKKGNNQIEIWVLAKGRVPTKLRSSVNWFYLASNMIQDNFTVTQDNARKLVQSIITDNEIIVDWIMGYIYYKAGNKIKRLEITDYKLMEKPNYFYPNEEVDEFERNVL